MGIRKLPDTMKLNSEHRLKLGGGEIRRPVVEQRIRCNKTRLTKHRVGAHHLARQKSNLGRVGVIGGDDEQLVAVSNLEGESSSNSSS